jgi:ATP-binding cassette subfamily B protein
MMPNKRPAEVAAFRRYRRSAGVLFGAGVRATPKWMIVAMAFQIVAGASSSLVPYILRLFTDAIYYRNSGRLVVAACVFAGLYSLGYVATVLGNVTSFIVAQRANLYITGRIAELVNGVPGLEHFERPEYLRELDLLNQNRLLISGASQQLLGLVFQLALAGVMLFFLATVNLYFLLLPIVALVPFAADNFSTRYRQRVDDELAETTRLANALFATAATAAPAKELRLFGISEELIRRHDALTEQIMRRTGRTGFITAGVGALGWVLFAAAFVAAIASVVVRAIHGHASPGQVLMVVLLVRNVQAQLTAVTSRTNGLLRARKTAERYVWLEDHARGQRGVAASLQAPERIQDGIRFDHVTFRYPGTDAAVLSDVTIRLPAGSAIAIVGDNGAGKSTLVKLLCRMYEPTSGSILIDGVDLEEIDVDRWRERISSTFQDFARFELRAGSTVGVGDLANIDDDVVATGALERAGSLDVLDRLDARLDTQLGRSFLNGRELSGGEWQKLALGRGRMRVEPLLLVLDEPTASLDAPTEHALFERYVAAARATGEARGAITILVSHRFSTVRIADLILVVRDGTIAEFGSHQQLMANNGTYAELYRLQSRAYA